MAKLVNLTPHNLSVYNTEGTEVIMTIPASGTTARVSVSQETVREIEGIPVVKTAFADFSGIPEYEEGTKLIVSTLVLTALEGRRPDVVAPDTGPGPMGAVRDAEGRILGVRRFQVVETDYPVY